VLRHRFSWKRLSMSAAVGYAPDGSDAWLVFNMRPGAYNQDSLIEFLEDLHAHLGGNKITLIWDGLPSHRSQVMKAWIAEQRSWLVVEQLPAYGHDLNPVELIWGISNRASLPTCARTSSTRPLPTPKTGSSASGPTATCASPSCGTAASSYDLNVTVLCEPL
jgi:hypothetical protein